MAKALYLEDSYAKEFDAVIASVEGDLGQFIVLDQTAFYPSSGGQPHDTGKIIKNNDPNNKNGNECTVEYPVIFVKKMSGSISHQVEMAGRPKLKPGDKVHCIIDWERRYKLMRMHTAAHVLAGVLYKETGAMITGNQLDTAQSRIDFALDGFDREKISEYFEKANKIAKEGHEIKAYYLDKNANVDEFLKLAKGLPPEITNIRIIDIAGFDAQPDGGTHVKNTSEIGSIEFLSAENKGKSSRRIYFTIKK